MSQSRSELVYKYTLSKLKILEKNFETSYGKATLANLRRGIGKRSGEMPELWGLIFENIPEELTFASGVSEAEWATYTALTLYALHQQGKNKNMHKEDISVGTATAHLVHSEDDKDRILKKLNLVATAVSQTDIAYHLKNIIYLLKNDEIELDYAKLAKDLYIFSNPEWSKDVIIRWGKDFYREYDNKSKGEKNNE